MLLIELRTLRTESSEQNRDFQQILITYGDFLSGLFVSMLPSSVEDGGLSFFELSQ